MKWRASVVQRSIPARLQVALLAALAFLACSSGKATTDEHHEFSDSAGHTCQATLAKTSPSSPPVSESVSCDSGAKQCSSESQPCFELSVDRETFALRNCPACCRGTASSFVSSECSAVLCADAADCVYRQAKCVEGACTCPNGSCD